LLVKNYLVWIALLALGAWTAGCGGGKSEHSSPVRMIRYDPTGRFAAIALPVGGAQPKIEPAEKPPPQKVLRRDLRVGRGKIARAGDKLTLYYYSVDYETGKRLYLRWPPQKPLVHKLAEEPWEKALIGMRVGGRREVIVPSRLLFKAGTVDYLFELRGIG
jgi:peptidylprolyl isomerase